MPRDPRWLQIAFLSSFLTLGLTVLDFSIALWQPAIVIGVACLTQLAMTRIYRIPPVSYLSTLITALGTTLLMRTDEPWVAVVASFLAVASKFVIRFRGKHVFNPSNFGLAAVFLMTTHAWTSPSEWGHHSAVAAWAFILGITVAHRALRSDVSLAFLVFWIGLKTYRVLKLGFPEPWDVLEHQLAVGALIVFSFFMISDPKTTPDSRLGRVLFALIVAVGAYHIQHTWWMQNGPIWALFLASPLVPLIDWLMPSGRFSWPSPERKTQEWSVSQPSPSAQV